MKTRRASKRSNDEESHARPTGFKFPCFSLFSRRGGGARSLTTCHFCDEHLRNPQGGSKAGAGRSRHSDVLFGAVPPDARVSLRACGHGEESVPEGEEHERQAELCTQPCAVTSRSAFTPCPHASV